MLLLVHCTHNPFGSDNEIIRKTDQITGKVDLTNYNSPQKVFVWLEGFDIGTWTDENGHFKIRIPPSRIQPAGGLSGIFNLYFYVSNYKLELVPILINKGELQLSHGNIDNNGKLQRTVFMRKILNIETQVSPESVKEDYSGEVSIELLLQATDDTVTVRFPDKAEGPLSILYFIVDNQLQNSIKIFENNIFAVDAPFKTDSITTVAQVWSSGFQFAPDFLAQGDYKIIPYFIINQQYVPTALLDNFGRNIERPVFDFINVPARRDGGQFKVTPGGETFD